MIECANSSSGLEQRRSICLYALCASIFLTGIFNGGFRMLATEWGFIFVYIALLRPFPSILRTIVRNKIVFALFALWSASLTGSLLMSPLQISNEPAAILRYVQTFSHVMFFFFVQNFFARHAVSSKWPMLSIPFSIVAVATIMAVLLFGDDLTSAETATQWFAHHPLNAHIRHTGYAITAALGVMTGFCLLRHLGFPNRPVILLLLTILFAFLFWTGGRGATLSVVLAFCAVGLIVGVKGGSIRFLGAAFVVALLAGLVLSELLAVFPWNGVLQMAIRSIEAQDVNEISSGRVDLWRSSWVSVKDYLVFGLGPHGYYFMPNRIFGVQPHSVMIQFLVEWGAVGTLLFTTFLAIGVYRGLRAHVIGVEHGVDPMRISAGAVIFALAVHGLFDGTFFHPQPSYYLALCFAVWVTPGRHPQGIAD